MNKVYTAIIKKDGNWWIGWIEEVPGRQLPGTYAEGIIRKLKSYIKRGFRI